LLTLAAVITLDKAVAIFALAAEMVVSVTLLTFNVSGSYELLAFNSEDMAVVIGVTLAVEARLSATELKTTSDVPSKDRTLTLKGAFSVTPDGSWTA
jgi:hypothetical protein